MKNLLPKTVFALVATFALTTQIVAAPVSSKMQMSQIKPLPFDTIPARGGVICITPIIHASIQIEYRGKVILVDPISVGTYRKKADLILITHSHPDHLDFKAISKVINNENATTSIISTPAIIESIKQNVNGKETRFLPFYLSKTGRLFHHLNWGAGKDIPIIIEAVPAYNIKRGPDATHKFHPKGAFNGYILTLGGKRIYIAGDTEATPEMKRLKNIDAAFIPMNLPYTMTPQEAAVGVRAFKPKVVYPYHFRYPFNQPNDNPQQFVQAMKGSGVQVRVLDWYNAAPVARFVAASAAKK
jgi:L-ascorbate metabolism protein UlaG (beta-lactamase superfamily)